MSRVLVADDEPLARERLGRMLRREDGIEIVGECADGDEVLAAIGTARPDILFLDVQMPGCDGLEVARRLPADGRPAVVFVTAHERFALDAFEAHAVDYLLKPFDADRLHLALERALQHVRQRRAETLDARVKDLLASAAERGSERLVFRVDGRVVFFRSDEIVWIEAANNYSTLHLADGKRLMVRETLMTLEKRLGTAKFARINRSAIVQLDEVRELQPTTYGDYTVVLRNGRRLPLSRTLRGRLEKFTPEGL